MLQGLAGWLGLGAVDELQPVVAEPPKIARMRRDIQQSVGAGNVSCNIKVVIRGMRGVGKTSLMRRLQGDDIPTTHVPTSSIQAATILWSPSHHNAFSKATKVAKIEIWDVVDRGVAVGNGHSTEGRVSAAHLPAMPTDSTTVDVYRYCHCAVFLFDVTRRETFEYVRRTVVEVPRHVPIVVCGNFWDKIYGEGNEGDREVTDVEIDELVDSLPPAISPFVSSLTTGPAPPPHACAYPIFIRTSLVNGFGMKPLHAYLNIPVEFAKALIAEEVVQAAYLSVEEARKSLRVLSQRQNFNSYVEWMSQQSRERAAEVEVRQREEGNGPTAEHIGTNLPQAMTSLSLAVTCGDLDDRFFAGLVAMDELPRERKDLEPLDAGGLRELDLDKARRRAHRTRSSACRGTSPQQMESERSVAVVDPVAVRTLQEQLEAYLQSNGGGDDESEPSRHVP